MRKRLVIGAIAAVVIGVAAYVVSKPRKGSVEYHRSRLAIARKVTARETLWDKTLAVVNRVLGTELRTMPDFDELDRRMDAEYAALRRLGYLVERSYRFTNTTPWIPHGVFGRVDFSRFGIVSNVLFVTAPRDELLVWDNAIAEADVTDPFAALNKRTGAVKFPGGL